MIFLRKIGPIYVLRSSKRFFMTIIYEQTISNQLIQYRPDFRQRKNKSNNQTETQLNDLHQDKLEFITSTSLKKVLAPRQKAVKCWTKISPLLMQLGAMHWEVKFMFKCHPIKTLKMDNRLQLVWVSFRRLHV